MDRRAPFFHVLLSFVMVCVQLREIRRCGSLKIRFSPPYPCLGGVSNIVGGCAEVCLQRISRDSVGLCLRWIHGGSCYRSFVFVGLQVGSFRSTLLFIDDSCCSRALGPMWPCTTIF